MKAKKYLGFKRARKLITRLGLSGEREWRLYCKSGHRPDNIPSAPCRIYGGSGWNGWGDWLGSGNIKYGKIKYLTFNKARQYIWKHVVKHKIDTQKKWYEGYRAIFQQKNKVPISVDYYYKNKGWVSWKHWLRSEDKPWHRKYSLNEDFFKEWSSDMAYILGFWWADGNIFKNTFTICQHKNDKHILDSFLEKLEYNGKLKKYKNCYIFAIYSKKIIKDIISLGGKERKSLNIKFPIIPKIYTSDFIRGYFDGDGTVTYDKKNKRYQCGFVSGSRVFIYSLHKKIKEFVPSVRGSIYKENKRCYRLNFSSHDTVDIGSFIYRDNKELRLERKYIKMRMAKRKYKNGTSSCNN